MYRYLCLSFCYKNKARICANNRNEWLSEGEPKGSISCRYSVVCFHFPLVSLWSKLVSVTASVSIVSERWLKARFGHERFSSDVFLFCPHDPPGGPFLKCIAHESSRKKSRAEWPTIPFAFPSQQQEYVCPVGIPFWKENRLFPVLQRAQSPRLFSEWCSKYGCLLFMRMFCN